MVTMPYVMDSKDGRGYDLFSRLLQDRIIMLTGEVNDEMAAYSEFSKKYQGSAIGEVSGAVNNTFLIINGTEGTKSYGMVVDLACAYYKD